MVQFNVTFNSADSPDLGLLTATERNNVLRLVEAAAEWWSRYLAPSDVVLDLEIVIDNDLFGADTLAVGGTDYYNTGTFDDGVPVYAPIAFDKINNGVDRNGSSADLGIGLTVQSIRNFLFFVADPFAETYTVTPGRYDALSILLHEIGHGLGFISFSESLSDPTFNIERSTFDAFITGSAFSPTFDTEPGFTDVSLTSSDLSHTASGLMAPAIGSGVINFLDKAVLEILDTTGIEMRVPTSVSDAIYAIPEVVGYSLLAGDDTFFGRSQAETVLGGDDNDTIYGNGGSDTISGEGGNDSLFGGAGDDNISGGDGDDIVSGGSGLNTLTGGNGIDRLSFVDAVGSVRAFVSVLPNLPSSGGVIGGPVSNASGFEVLEGSSFNDILFGYGDGVVLIGGPGGDQLVQGSTGPSDPNTIQTASYSTALSGVAVNLELNQGTLGDALGDTFGSIENLIGSPFDDSLIGNAADNVLDGGWGGDFLSGRGGWDTVTYKDSLSAVQVQLAGTSAGGLAQGDTYDTIEAVIGTAFGDSFIGSVGADWFQGGLGGDSYDGSGGADTVSYADSLLGVTVSLDGSVLSAGGATGDTLLNIENLEGTPFLDVFFGSSADNTFVGSGGGDTFDGKAGFDIVDYRESSAPVVLSIGSLGSGGLASGDNYLSIEGFIGSNLDGDTITGDGNANYLDGGKGVDTLIGGLGNDSYIINSKNDTVIELSGEGIDHINFVDEVGAGDGGYVLANNVENLTISGSHNSSVYGYNASGNSLDNLIIGDDRNNTINGAGGADTIYGNGGNDYLRAGIARGIIFGGAGNDNITGLDGDDYLDGGDGSDGIFGGLGADEIHGGRGRDVIYGWGNGQLIMDHGRIAATRVGSGFSSPVFATSAPGDAATLYVVEKDEGRIRKLNPGTGIIDGTPFLDILNTEFVTGGEQGLLGLAFHPDYATNGHFYVFLTNASGNLEVRRYTRGGDGNADLASVETVLTIARPGQTNHNGGWIGFGPDGLLYVAVGDGGGGGDPSNNAQNTDSLLGKILRIDVDGDDFAGDATRNYAIPSGNPFVGVAGADEIFAYGLRNPWRNSFDSRTGDFYIADVGQGQREEVNFIEAGATGPFNFGWKVKEGTIVYDASVPGNPSANDPGLIDPIVDYPHIFSSAGGFSITGGYVYRGPDFGAQGLYFFADFVTDQIWTVRVEDGAATEFENRTGQFLLSGGGDLDDIASFATDGANNLYIIGLDGDIHRLNPREGADDAGDTIFGDAGNDVVYGGAGSDIIDGGSGLDIGAYFGPRSNYTLTKSGATWTISGTEGTDTYTTTERFQFTDQVIQVSTAATGAFDGNETSDFLWQNADGHIALWLLDGPSLSAAGLAGVNPGPDWSAKGAGDFNNDGIADIVFQNTNGTVAAWMMDGFGVLSAVQIGGDPGAGWRLQGAFRLGQDTSTSLLWRHDNGLVAYWGYNGTTVYGTGLIGPNPGPTWLIMGTGDFNGDAHTDILWQNQNGLAAIWQLTSSVVAATSLVGGPVDPSWQIKGTGDFNADGKADILWQNTNGLAAIWLMDGFAVMGSAVVGNNLDPGWQIITSGDYDGDGDFDIAWRYGPSGQTAHWYMDGLTVTGTAIVGSAVDSSWRLIAPGG